jgi:hypothetical protein
MLHNFESWAHVLTRSADILEEVGKDGGGWGEGEQGREDEKVGTSKGKERARGGARGGKTVETCEALQVPSLLPPALCVSAASQLQVPLSLSLSLSLFLSLSLSRTHTHTHTHTQATQALMHTNNVSQVMNGRELLETLYLVLSDNNLLTRYS